MEAIPRRALQASTGTALNLHRKELLPPHRLQKRKPDKASLQVSQGFFFPARMFEQVNLRNTELT